ncbi:MAG: hypothetical protein F4Y07_00570 [Gemmatimonadetes bacterium]|nr:hypothetical protein [Gemmatimonadota bacterium]MYE14951.1 hypothetical protein [Gemmatimonadota bacterium]
MNHLEIGITRTVLGLFAALALFGATGYEPLAAQSGGSGFLFGNPRATLTFKGGVSLPRAAGGNGQQSLWDLTREELTVETADLRGASIIGELAVRASERLDVTLAVGYSASETRSEFRDWEGSDGLPIEQTTRFTTTPVTAGVKAYLFERGRSVGSLAWIPRTWNPYVGVAGGLVSYSFRQHGEFVHYDTYDIFQDDYFSRDRAPTVHFLGGMEMSVNRHVLLVGEARYGFASAPLSEDFVGFPDLDLAGFQATAGISLRW